MAVEINARIFIVFCEFSINVFFKKKYHKYLTKTLNTFVHRQNVPKSIVIINFTVKNEESTILQKSLYYI